MLHFYKYQGAGNDFVMVDNRKAQLGHQQHQIELLCDRRFGIGADGLILLESHPDYDFQMVYFNADGRESSMCGNGGRCIMAFAQFLGIVENKARFLAIDGPHEATIESNGLVRLKMSDVASIEKSKNDYILDTGSPHFVRFIDQLNNIDVYESGKAIRYGERFKQAGINVNFVEETATELRVATYERGVEGETLACGTGVTACAIAYALKSEKQGKNSINVKAKGGDLSVCFERQANSFTDIWLIGPAKQVFEGRISL